MFIPTQIVNFAVVPTHLRFVTIGIVSLFWSASSPLSSRLVSPSVRCQLTMSISDDAIARADAYLSSVNAKKQAQLALEHQQGLHALENEEKIAAVA